MNNNNNNNDHPLPGVIWQLTEQWYGLVLRTLKQQQEQQPQGSSALTAIVAVLKDWEMAWQWTRTAFQQHYNDTSTNTAATRFCRQIVLAHMDCQSLNLLVPLEDDSRNQSNKLTNNHPHGNHDCMRVIDYEYCGLNPRAADIANTFCEMCQMNEIKADWELEYPSQETQDELLRAYLRQLEHGGCSDGKEDGSNKDNSSANNFSLSDMRHEVGRYTLVSHLSWTVWALLYAARHLSKCDIHSEEEGCFNYLAYAQQRMDGYRYFRAHFWERDSSS
jgi:ethanolamine kinase